MSTEILINPERRITREDVTVEDPNWLWPRCPGCKDPAEWLAPLPAPSLWQIDDEGFGAGWLVVYGWTCGNSVHGSIVLRGADASRGEKLPRLVRGNHDFQFIKNLPGRVVTPYEVQGND